MPAYVISEVDDVRDPAAFEVYRTIAAKTIAQYGGRYLVRGGSANLIEGSLPPKTIIVVEFQRWSACANGMPRRNTRRR